MSPPRLLLAGLALGWFAACGAGEPEQTAQTAPAEPSWEDLLAIVQEGAASADPAMRAEAHRLAGHSNRPELAAVLRTGLQDQEPVVRASATQALLERGLADANAHIIEQLTRGPRAGREGIFELAMRFGSLSGSMLASAGMMFSPMSSGPSPSASRSPSFPTKASRICPRSSSRRPGPSRRLRRE